MILTTLWPLSNRERFDAWWGAHRYIRQADRLIPIQAVRPVNKINLATKTSRVVIAPNSRGAPPVEGTGCELRQTDRPTIRRVILSAFGLVCLLALAWSLPALVGAVLRELWVR